MNIDWHKVDADRGLSTDQVHKRVEADEINHSPKTLTKSVWEIIKINSFTLFNLINVVLAAFVIYTGSYKNLLFLVVAVVNTVIGSFQEIRSKRQIDKMTLLSRDKTTVIRDGQSIEIDPSQIVVGDVIELTRGSQVPVDGIVLTTSALEVDESQITGESDSISKQPGDEITSASSVVSGNAKMVAVKVGAQSFVNQISAAAKDDGDSNGKMLKMINKIIQILTFIIIPLGIILFTSKVLRGSDINNAILGTVASATGMIPEGLVLLSSMTLAVSAMKLARKRVLVRNLPVIETLARVDTICLDKTGTITSGELAFEQLVPLAGNSVDSLKQAVGAAVHSIGDDNETATALKAAMPNPGWHATEVHPFSSARKWSGATFANGSYMVGAPQFVVDQMTNEQAALVKQYAEQGNRVLAIAKADHFDGERAVGATMIGLILISDVIRPNAEQTLSFFASQDVDINVISGDDPVTVSSIAKRVKIKDADKYIDMSTVGANPDYGALTKQYTVFGRVTPNQKRGLIKGYQYDGHTVAMTGDGVNDMPALKQSDCGIVMASGSESAKSIANFVLIDSNFDSMIDVLKEGRRVINNIGSVASLYLIKTIYSTILTLLFIFATHDYPFLPIQLTPISTFMIGIPSFILAFEANYQRVTNQFTAKIVEIAVPAAFSIVFYVLAILFIAREWPMNYAQTSTLSVLATGVCCWIALILVSRPLNPFKSTVVAGTGLIFLFTFIVTGKFFSLVSIFAAPMIWVALLIVLTAYPLILGIQLLVNKFKRFNK
ncbi:cation-translocating P-type ATPase [Nicoliella spurrieriana]|uniref:Cation-translocating P-type ATPase n=1 Tax=Nicoliella spurrieriana TaxID=2925830 RepID=A0A976RSQ6_9LACO|nr:cation-translocating P-type ATPase [Nicoliella spurrieriana]UQS87168.1 cation-translocating P-type ATPase [Nicoliella spurrieriana]